MAFEVHTPLGLGIISKTDVVRGRKSYKVAGRGFDKWFDESEIGFAKEAWAPVDHDNSVALPYDPTPQYPAIPGDTESTLQPIHEIDADERLSPADSITFENRGDDESELEPTGPNFESRHAAFGGYPSHGGMEADPHDAYPPGHPAHDYYEDDFDPHDDPAGQPGFSDMDGPSHPDFHHEEEWHPSDQYGDLNQPYPADTWRSSDAEQNRFGSVEHEGSTVHDAFAFLIPLAEGLAGAGAGSAAAGAAESAGMGAVGQGVARGVGSGAAHSMMGGDDGSGGSEGVVDQTLDATAPGEGWGPLTRGASSLDDYLASRERPAEGVGAGLSDKYIDITATADFHNDPVAQFQHDPIAYIQRIGHVENDPVSAEMEHYGQLVEANSTIREAAWKDVRAKAMRLRREGKVAVKDVAPDRIYASVEGDTGTYDVMIAKEGAFGGIGGGHAISNWRCGCEWGRWAFQRRLTYVGRLCSHGYATYMTMQSAHMKGQERAQKLTPGPRRKRADALQGEPQRLVPELVVNSEDDAHTFLDVTKDTRKDVGPDDIVSDEDIVHFARVMSYCDRKQLPYPRELTAYLLKRAEDQTKEDWKVTDTGHAGHALEEIRDWADTPQSEDYGHMEERNDDIRDAIEQAREDGVDASQLVAFRTAAPEDRDDDTSIASGGSGQPNSLQDMMGVSSPSTPMQSNPFAGGGFDPSQLPGVSGSPNTPAPGGGPLAGTPAGDMINGGQSSGGAATPPSSGTPNPTGWGASGKGSWGGAGGAGGGVGDATATPGSTYTVKPGDNLSDIAQSHGGVDYNNITNAGGGSIADKNLITPGQQLSIPGGAGGGLGHVDTSAASGSSGSGAGASSGGVNTNAVGGASGTGGSGSGGSGSNSPGGWLSDSSSSSGGSGSAGASAGSSALSQTQRNASIFADQDDYDEWVRYAYPDAKARDHKPFNGSGGDTSIEFTTSEGYADKARKGMEDVEDLDYDISKPVNPRQSAVGGGIKRVGNGPRKATVVPEVVREQKTGRQLNQTVEASMESFGSFDPLAARTPDDFLDDDAAGLRMAAQSGDIVGDFQRWADSSGSAITASASTGYDDFASSPAVQAALVRTAGRNYSLAEQNELIREGDIGGAGNLDKLQLAGTHYIKDPSASMDSVGLW